MRVTVTFEVTNECLLKVSAKEDKTGREVSTTLSTRDTPEAVKAKLAEVAAQAPPPEAAAPAEVAPRRGFIGWLKGLFGG